MKAKKTKAKVHPAAREAKRLLETWGKGDQESIDFSSATVCRVLQRIIKAK